MITADGESYCWGHNYQGALGSGGGGDIGKSSGDMANLQAINWGSKANGNAHAVTEIVGGSHTCVLLSYDASVKCVGRGNRGALGYEASSNMGGSADTIGDNLPSVNLGTGTSICPYIP